MNNKTAKHLDELARRVALTKILNSYYSTSIRLEGNKVYVLGLMLEISEAEDIIKEINDE